jgi:hypothetical protein
MRFIWFFQEWARLLFKGDSAFSQWSKILIPLITLIGLPLVFQPPVVFCIRFADSPELFFSTSLGWALVIIMGIVYAIGIAGAAWVLSSGPRIIMGNVLEFDKQSSMYRLPGRNKSRGNAKVIVSVENVIGEEGRPHEQSPRLPLKLQWMHNPNSDSVELGYEKADVVQVITDPPQEARLNIVGAIHKSFEIRLAGSEKVYLKLVAYGSENRPLASKWCCFEKNKKSPTGYVATVVKSPLDSAP